MSSNHTLLTLGAFLILTTTLQNFYGLLGATGDDISDAQDMILATTLTTSYFEIAQGLAYDEVTDTSSIAYGNPDVMTSALSLGHESSAEDTLARFNDFDDFNRYQIEREIPGTGRRYHSAFSVWYVNPNNVGEVMTSRTFVKRIDCKTWRTFPPPAGTTLAGNLLIVGSIANIIVVDAAARRGVLIDWRAHARIGVPVTLATLALTAAWFWVRLPS